MTDPSLDDVLIARICDGVRIEARSTQHAHPYKASIQLSALPTTSMMRRARYSGAAPLRSSLAASARLSFSANTGRRT